MKKVTYIEAITQALYEEMERDEKVFLIGQDIGLYGGVFKATKGLMDRFGRGRPGGAQAGAGNSVRRLYHALDGPDYPADGQDALPFRWYLDLSHDPPRLLRRRGRRRTLSFAD